ncbi:MAG: AI-2E family transporter [Myxococcota bacterium]
MPALDTRRALRWVLLAALVGVLWMVQPFLQTLLLSAVATLLIWPVQRRMVTLARGRRSLAAGLTLLAVTVGIIGPVATLAVFVTQELVVLANEVALALQAREWSEILSRLDASPALAPLRQWTGAPLSLTLRDAARDASLSVAGALGELAGGIVKGAAAIGLKTIIFYMATFTLLVRAPDLLAWARRVSPLEDAHVVRLYEVFAEFAQNVVIAGLVTGMLQGVVAGVGYLVAGVDRPLLFAVLTGLLAYVPLIGTSLVWVPLCVTLVATGEYRAAGIVLAWSLLLTTSVDNFVKPLLVRGRTDVPAVLVFLGVFGGLRVFGLLGVLIGPVLVATLLALFKIYEEGLDRPA